ncbi:MAG: glycosyltransferase [Hyphomicrobiales bacterium]|nr:glycosyltransferase [Hyphomicrobiales bacterium]
MDNSLTNDTTETGREPSAPVRVKFVGRVPHNVAPRIWQRQLPGHGPDYHGCRFLFDLDEEDYDWLVVYDDLPTIPGERFSTRTMELACPPEHTILLTMEPSTIKLYGSAFLSQFGVVISSQEPEVIRHRGHVHSQAGLRWYYGLGSTDMMNYDELSSTPPLDKTRVISTVCSSKRQRHTLHNLRWDFTQKLARLIPELEVFGHGVRAMDDKAEALGPYRYHVAVENFEGPHHWTEKLADSFLACTLPFYFGAPNAGDYFPEASFIPIDIHDAEGAAEIIRGAIENNEWEKRLPAIMEARRRVLEEHNLFALVARHIRRLDALAASAPGGTLRSRRAARKANPLAALPDFTTMALRKAKAIFKPMA